ncbi:hypothetical protein L1987_01192 [Smallanthus sonchifolius]|uniref:Uncharacterized protein n=1 Tax=Smallanthus sonchifolius TaxID=185202 RepID=A0ACB9K4J5_9ASTR|nr:hypothetical protein L1987_01192 [Smallanthus sonchifolius]
MVSPEKIILSKVSDSRVIDLWNGNSGSGGDSGTVLLFLYPPITRVASLIAEVGGGSSNVREVWKLRFNCHHKDQSMMKSISSSHQYLLLKGSNSTIGLIQPRTFTRTRSSRIPDK